MTITFRGAICAFAVFWLAAGQQAWSQENATYVTTDGTRFIWGDSGGMETITALLEVTGIAASTGTATQAILNNSVVESDNRAAEIGGSFNRNIGVFAVNQSSGNVNNQTNVAAVAIVGDDQAALQTTQVTGIQELHGNELRTGGALVARIDNSFNDMVGIASVNVAAGSMNQQLNMLSLTFGRSVESITPILAEASLAQIGTEQDNLLVEDATSVKEQSVNNSFNNFVGIVQGSAVAGNMNRVGNLLAVSVQTVGAP